MMLTAVNSYQVTAVTITVKVTSGIVQQWLRTANSKHCSHHSHSVRM